MIDAHHHLWSYSAAEYGWITEDMQTIRRSFRATELDDLMRANGITGTVAVQARTCLEENDFLLDEAAGSQLIRGIVGWVDFKSPEVGEQLDQYRSDSLFKGVREVIQGSPDDEFLSNNAFNRGIREVTRRGLTYDLLIFQDQLDAATAFVKRHPEQSIVLDHAAKPEIRADRFPAEWETGIRALAALDNTACKISGLATEVRDSSWIPDILRRYLDVLLDAFGPSRLMFGSDWPVCLLATPHAAWVETVTSHLASLSATECEAILTGTATTFYRLAL
ncbi:amidohydrolase family protein [Luteolibacter ambystomatis]|uniref:Amidohydrolase family protein n=1 Tax=Luteolibacter ambystomatis TaxID=2824561 RepID=A0A975J042_9BACT|nr:amidohydrolase family protein [Luteolibacter ambystomatis]QUE51559.1 amidohydrolase family protein [Luteolibacter ambystomatis]